MNAITRHEPPRLAGAKEWTEFLRPLIPAVRNPPTREEFLAKVSAVIFALPDVPAEMLTTWRQQEAVRKFQWFPTPAEIAEWLAPDLRGRRESAALASLPAPEQPARQPRSMEEVMAVKAKAQAFRAEMAAKASPVARNEVKPCPLAPHHLLAAWEDAAKRGVPGAELRFAALRKQYQIEEGVEA